MKWRNIAGIMVIFLFLFINIMLVYYAPNEGDLRPSQRPSMLLNNAYLAVCAVIRDESEYVVEWIAFHQTMGAAIFYLYDHHSTDHNLKEILALEIEAGFVVIIDWSDCDRDFGKSSSGSTNCQLNAFDHYFVNFGKQSFWTLFIDVDEFVFLVDEQSNNTSLATFLKDFEKYHSVGLVSLSYGTSNRYWRPEGLVLGNYQTRTPVAFGFIDQSNSSEQFDNEQFYEEMFKLKSIVRSEYSRAGRCGSHLFYDSRIPDPKSIDHITVLTDHVPLRGCGDASHDPLHCLKKGCSVMTPLIDKVRINHYRTKSLEDYLEKVSKGLVQGKWEMKQQSSPFYLIDRNEVLDTSVFKYMKIIKVTLSNRARRVSNYTSGLLLVAGAPESGISLTTAILGLANAYLGSDSNYLKCRDRGSAPCSPYYYPLGYWNHHKINEANKLIYGENSTNILGILSTYPNLKNLDYLTFKTIVTGTLKSISSVGRISILQNTLFCFSIPIWLKYFQNEISELPFILVVFQHPIIFAQDMSSLKLSTKYSLLMWEYCYSNLLWQFPEEKLLFLEFDPSEAHDQMNCLFKEVAKKTGNNSLRNLSTRRLRNLVDFHFPNFIEEERLKMDMVTEVDMEMGKETIDLYDYLKEKSIRNVC